MTNREKDERILARIIASAQKVGASLGHNGWGVDLTEGIAEREPADDDIGDYSHAQPDGPVCAIGAGILWQGVGARVSGGYIDPIQAFAKLHRVSVVYAVGVSNGYESEHSNYMQDLLRYQPDALYEDEDYLRGYAVGEAVRAYAEDS